MLKNFFILVLVLSTTRTFPTDLQSNYSLSTTNSSYIRNERVDPTMKSSGNHTKNDEDEVFDESFPAFLDYDNSTSGDALEGEGEESVELFILIKQFETPLNESLRNATAEHNRSKRATEKEPKTERPKRDYRRNPVLQG